MPPIVSSEGWMMFCYGTIFQPVLRLRLSIFVMLLLNTIAAPVHATGDFQGSVVWRVDNPFHPYGFNLFPDQIQACQTFAEYVSRIHNQPVASIPACYPTGGNGYVQLNTMVDTVSSDGSLIHWTYIAGLAWASCPSNSYPQTGPSMVNDAVMPGRCACNTGYQPNSTSTGCEQPSPCQPPDVTDPATGQCVKCPISDLPPITDPEVQVFEDNPNISDTAHLTNEMQTALQRLVAAASAAGGAPTVGSAYRPPAYNQHLIDVWEKYMEFLRSADNPEITSNVSCMLVLWPKIQRHFQKHGLLVSQSPVPNSRHTRGLAVDVTINLPSANIDALAADAGLRRPLPVTDPVHFQFP